MLGCRLPPRANDLCSMELLRSSLVCSHHQYLNQKGATDVNCGYRYAQEENLIHITHTTILVH
jgi:hypothetical protein